MKSGSTYFNVNTYYINEKLQVVGRIGETLTSLYKQSSTLLLRNRV